MAKKAKEPEAPTAEVRASGVCSICGVTADDIDLHNSWHESQQEMYAGLHAEPAPTGVDATVLFAPPVEEPEPVPLTVTVTEAAPVLEDQTIIHVPKT